MLLLAFDTPFVTFGGLIMETTELEQRKQVAAWIEMALAIPNVRESKLVFLAHDRQSGSCLACALGLALVGKFGNAKKALIARYYQAKNFAEPLGISMSLANDISYAHLRSTPAIEIARRLKNGEEV